MLSASYLKVLQCAPPSCSLLQLWAEMQALATARLEWDNHISAGGMPSQRERLGSVA